MEEGGWIKINRSFLNWEWYRNEATFKVFVHCLLKANWTKGRFEGVEVPEGAFITSLQHLSEETGLTINRTRKALEHLEKTGEIHKQTTNRYTLITVCSWKKYQDTSQTDNKQSTNKAQQYKNNKNKKNIYTPPPPNHFEGERVIDYEDLAKRLINK